MLWDAAPMERYTTTAETAIRTQPAALSRFAESWMIPIQVVFDCADPPSPAAKTGRHNIHRPGYPCGRDRRATRAGAGPA